MKLLYRIKHFLELSFVIINSANNLYGRVDNSRVPCLVFKGLLLVELNQGIIFLREGISLVSGDMHNQ